MKSKSWAAAAFCGTLAMCLCENIPADAATLNSSLSVTYYPIGPQITNSDLNDTATSGSLGVNPSATISGLNGTHSSAYASFQIDPFQPSPSVSAYASAINLGAPTVSASSTSSLTYSIVLSSAYSGPAPFLMSANGTGSNANYSLTIFDVTKNLNVSSGIYTSPITNYVLNMTLNDIFEITLTAHAEVHVSGGSIISQATIDAPTFVSLGPPTQLRFLDLERAPATTPLPASLPLFASGLGALGLLGWRRKRKAALTA
jgi:hypothetical protein